MHIGEQSVSDRGTKLEFQFDRRLEYKLKKYSL